PPYDLETLTAIAEELAQLVGAIVGLHRLGRRPPPDGHQGRTERGLEAQLLPLALGRIAERSEQLKALRELPDGLDIGTGTQGALSGGEPVVDRAFDQSTFGTMMREELGLRDRHLREALLERLGDASVQLSPRAAQQGAVRGVLHQRVLEGVLRIGGHAAPEDQFGADQLRQGIVQFPLRYWRDGADQLVRELPAER